MPERDNRITIDDLARMIQESVAHKSDLERLETNLASILVRIEGKIDALPDRVADRIVDYANLKNRVDNLERHAGLR